MTRPRGQYMQITTHSWLSENLYNNTITGSLIINPECPQKLSARLRPDPLGQLMANKANSAFHPSGVGKWVPASAGKAKAGMVRSASRCTRGVQVNCEIPWERVPYVSALEVCHDKQLYKSTFFYLYLYLIALPKPPGWIWGRQLRDREGICGRKGKVGRKAERREQKKEKGEGVGKNDKVPYQHFFPLPAL